MTRLAFLLSVLGLVVFAGSAQARTTLTAEPSVRTEDGMLGIRLRAEITDAINAVGLTVSVGAPVEIVRFDDDDAAVRLWVQRDISGGELILQGVIPGGAGPVFSDTVDIGTVWVRADGTDPVRVSFHDVEVYLNQPTPTRDDVTADTAVISGAEWEQGGSTGAVRILDADVRVVREPDLNDGRRTLVYDIKTDQGTVQTVRIRERWLGLFGAWRDVDGQAPLSDSLGVSILEVALHESDGGGRVATVRPPALYAVWGVIALLILSAVVRFVRRH